MFMKLTRACGVPVGQRSGGQLVTILVATINIIISFHFFCSLSQPFLIERVLGSQNLFSKSFLERHFGFCRRYGDAGGEQVPPAPLGCYFITRHFTRAEHY